MPTVFAEDSVGLVSPQTLTFAEPLALAVTTLSLNPKRGNKTKRGNKRGNKTMFRRCSQRGIQILS